MPSDRLRVVSNLVAIPLGIALSSPGSAARELVAAARAEAPLLAAPRWTFAIWALIFGGQVVYAVYQALPRQRRDATLRRIGYATALNGLLGGAWAAAFVHGLLFLSWVVLLALLANLLLIEHRLGEGARDLAAPLAIAWGLLGVAVYRHSVAPALALLALVLSGALLLLVVSTARTSAHDRRRAFLEK